VIAIDCDRVNAQSIKEYSKKHCKDIPRQRKYASYPIMPIITGTGNSRNGMAQA
jgi:hypothetical protein